MIRPSTGLLPLALSGATEAQEPHRFLSTENELAILGTARIRATTEFFLRIYRDIERFETGWGVTKKLSDREHGDDGFYFVALNRYRTDLPGGLFGKMARKAAGDGARRSTERYLTATQGAIEKYFRDERGR